MSVTAPEIDFEEHNSFLFSVLGLLSASSGVRAIAPAPASAEDTTPGPLSVEPEALPPSLDDAILQALLGIVSLALRVERVADFWAGDPLPETQAQEEPARRVEDLLR